MIKWKKQGVLLSICVLFLFGCGKQEEVLEEEKNTPIVIPQADEITITPMDEIASTMDGIIIEEEEEEIPIDIDACNAMNRKLTRTMESGESFFYLQKDTGDIYFVNQNQDNYLYRIKEGKVELVVELPVKELYVWNDFVYFMIESYDTYELEEKKDGDIYRYDTKTGVVELVYAVGAIEGSKNHKMIVNEQGIHFNYSKEISKEDGMTLVRVYFYSLPFDATEPVKDTTKIGKTGWKDYYFSYEFSTEDDTKQATLQLVSRITGDSIPLEIGEFQYCVVGDAIYSTTLGSATISLLNLESQEVKKYDFQASIKNANMYLEDEVKDAFGKNIEQISSFTITENGKLVWATDGEYLYRLNTTNGIIIEFETIDGGRKIENLYTDGKQVYGLYASERTKTTSLVRFCMEEIEEKDGRNFVLVEYLASKGEN